MTDREERTGKGPNEENVAGVSVLLVDDDETMRLICRRFLARCGEVREVQEAASGEEAIELLRARSFDCVLSDYRMGAVSGIDVLAFARANRPKSVRVLFTGFAAPAILQDAMMRAGVHEFLEKPMTTSELEALLREKLVEPFLKPLAKRVQEAGAPPR